MTTANLEATPTQALERLRDNYIATLADLGATRGADGAPAVAISPSGRIATVTAPPLLGAAIRQINAILKRRAHAQTVPADG